MGFAAAGWFRQAREPEKDERNAVAVNPMPPHYLPPRTYVEWSRCLHCLLTANDDERVFGAMRQGVGGFESGVVEHLARRVSEVFDARLKMAHARFARQMSYCLDTATMSRAILDFRRQLAFLHCVSQIEAFPVTLREHLGQMLDQAAKNTQDSLEESAKFDRSGETSACARRNSLLRFRDEPWSVAQQGEAIALLATSGLGARRARTIL